MKYILLPLFLFPSLAFAQTDSLKFPLIAYWSKQDTFTYEVTKLKQKFQNGEFAKNDTTIYRALFIVEDSTETDYIIRWEFQDYLKQTMDFSPALEEVFQTVTIDHLIYRTSELGEFLEILNWQEISTFMEQIFEIAVQQAVKNENIPEDKFRQIMQPLMTSYQSQEGIESKLFEELRHLHYPFGVEYVVGDTINYEDQLPNLFGGEPFRTEVQLYIDTVYHDIDNIQLVQHQQINEKDMRKTLFEFFSQLGMNDDEVKSGMEKTKMSISDKNVYEIYHPLGIPVYVNKTRIVDFSDDTSSSGSREEIIIEYINE